MGTGHRSTLAREFHELVGTLTTRGGPTGGIQMMWSVAVLWVVVAQGAMDVAGALLFLAFAVRDAVPAVNLYLQAAPRVEPKPLKLLP